MDFKDAEGAEMTQESDFIDFYRILQVSPDCDTSALEAAYRHLAKRYHPDHLETADVEKFAEVMEAYKVLRQPDHRAEYDLLYSQNVSAPASPSASPGEAEISDNALSDGDAHAKILLFLYEKRRENAQDPGVAGFYAQQLVNCSDELFDFHAWYLKEKGYIVSDEQGRLAITVEGVDHVISSSRSKEVAKLLIRRTRDSHEEDS